MEYILQWRHPAATQIPESGGKGANLARLTQAGFAVPPGFVIRARAYRDYTAGCAALSGRIACLPFDDPTGLRTKSRELREGLAAVELPAALQE